MKWGVRKDRDTSGNRRPKKKRITYEEKVRNKLEEYHQQHKGRSKKDNYTIALREEARKENTRSITRTAVSMSPFFASVIAGMASPVAIAAAPGAFAVTAGAATVTAFISKHRNDTLNKISDEYNVEGVKRILNV